MSTFTFNRIIILESLLPTEFRTGSELKQRLNKWASDKGEESIAETVEIHSMQDWNKAWDDIYTEIEAKNIVPIIHLEMHGDKTAMGIDKGTKGIIPLNDVFQKVQRANVLSHNNVFLSLAVCMGLNVIRGLKVYEPMPFCGVLSSLETINNQELLENYTIFYESFLETFDLDKANQCMKDAGVDSTKYELYKPEQIFMNAYLGYLETYRTDEQIREKALNAAKGAMMTFQNADEEKCFVRDYRCSLLLTENNEYKLAVNTFFMFDRYPSICSRFDVPKDIYEFKVLGAQNGHNWLTQKRPLTDDDVKGLSLQILHEVDKFCKVNDINYSLAYGTMIGAIRHKGFIPWDDDIDIMMLRTDYEKFIACFNQYKPDLFSVASIETDSNFHYPMAKIVCNVTSNDELGYTGCGFAIDLFPIDKISDADKDLKYVLKQKKRCWYLYALKTMRWSNNRRVIKNLLMCALKVVTSFISYSYIHKKLKRVIRKYSDLKDGYYLGCIYTPYGSRDIMSKDIFEKTIEVPFEQSHFSCIKEYDRYLTNVYGNYMKYPPVEQQVTHHDFVAYWK